MNVILLILGVILGSCITTLVVTVQNVNKELWDDEYIKHYDLQLAKSLSVHGDEEQVRQYAEEASELTIALNKWLRKHKDVTCVPSICEEVADVMIMLRQIKLMCNLKDEDINSIVSYKIKREMKRIKNEKV